jgi:hypothetical protein
MTRPSFIAGRQILRSRRSAGLVTGAAKIVGVLALRGGF